jgi:aspartate racemase
MKTIGLLGGMSWESTLGYYRAINEGVRQKLGGLHSAQIAMVSVDFARGVEAAGADFLLICTNTMHRLVPQIEAAIRIPVLHIADATAEVLLADGVGTVGLLGTAFTMEQAFYRGRLAERYGLEVLVPHTADRDLVHRVIYEELCQGRVEPGSKAEYLRIVASLAARGAEVVILGCTEIGMLIGQRDTEVRLLDTTLIHAQKAVELATA